MTKQKYSTASLIGESSLRTITLWGLAALLFFPPFFRGLFFQKEQQWALLFAAFLFGLTWFGKLAQREISFLKKPVDYLALGLILAYLISFFSAANPRLALAEIIKYGLYFLIFWMCSQLVRSRSDVKILLHALYIAGVGVALAGVMCATGMIEIKDGFLSNRIYSTMQYPNALASYLAALTFIGMYLWMNGGFWEELIGDRVSVAGSLDFGAFLKNSWPQYLYTLGNYMLLLIYIGTGSRGGLIVYPVALLVYFIGMNRECRVPVFGHFLLTFLAAAIANIRLMPSLTAGNHGAAWGWLLTGALAALCGQLILSFGLRIKFNRRYLGIAAAVLLIFMVVFGWTQVNNENTESKLMPGHLIGAIQNISLQQRNVQERFVFWQDAFKIVKEHPVFGFGGGAFEETYRHYQSYFYSSTQVHNHYMQMWAEVGTVGLLIFTALWVFYKLTVWKLWRGKKDRETKFLVWSMFAVAITLGMHAFLDFDLSLSAIAIVLFAVLGLTRGVERFTDQEYRVLDGKTFGEVKLIFQAGVVIASLGIMIFMVMLSQGTVHAKAGAAAFKEGQFPKARTQYEKALKMDAFNVDYRMDLAKVYLNLGEEEKAVQMIDQVLETAPYHISALSDAVSICLSVGEIDKGLEYSERLTENFPFNASLWEGLTYRYFVVGYQGWTKGDRDQCRKMLEKAVGVPARIDALMSGVTDQYKRMWGPKLPVTEVTPVIKLYSGAASYILNDFQTAEENLQSAFGKLEDKKMKGEAAMWLALLYLKQGRTEQTEIISAAGKKLMNGFEDNILRMKELQVLE